MCMYVINICYHILEQLSISFFANFLCKILTFSPILFKIYKKITVDKPGILCNNKIDPISYAYSARHGVRNERVRLKTDVPPSEERRKT